MEIRAEWGDVAAGEEAVDVGLGVPVFVAVTGVAEESVVAEAFQVAVFYAKECHQGFVVVKWRGGECGNPFLLTLHQEQDLIQGFGNGFFIIDHEIIKGIRHGCLADDMF